MKRDKRARRGERAPQRRGPRVGRRDDEHADSGTNAAGETAPRAFVDPEEAGDVEVATATEAAPALVRLNKYLADHGVASRRKCDELIAGGQVTVDGDVTTELGRRIDPERQSIEIDGYILKPHGLRRRYYLLNKPAGVVCTNEPRETRPRAVDLITDARKGRIYTVGRLDEESTGLILLTNDGDFANRIMHPRFGVEKTYLVRVAGRIDDDALMRIREGVHLSEGRTSGARVLVEKRMRDHSMLTVTLREGMNREIRRAFAQVGYKVLDLRRVRIGPLTDRGIKIGRWRELTRDEIAALLAGRNETPREEREHRARHKHRGAQRRGLHRNREFGDRSHARGGDAPRARHGADFRTHDDGARSERGRGFSIRRGGFHGSREEGRGGRGPRDVGARKRGFRDGGIHHREARADSAHGRGPRDVGMRGRGARDGDMHGRERRYGGVHGHGPRDGGGRGRGSRDGGAQGRDGRQGAGSKHAPHGRRGGETRWKNRSNKPAPLGAKRRG